MKIIIIGAVAAGMSAAAKARRLDKNAEIIVYEKTDVVSFGACGLPYFVGNYFENKDEMIARSADKIIESGIDLKLFHEVIDVDFDKKEVVVKNINTGDIFRNNYDKLMIATGASAKLLDINGINLKNIFTLKSLEDGVLLKEQILKNENKNIVILGAGFIGIEMAHAAHKLGKNVTIIQLNDRILQDTFDKEITDLLEEELLDKGINLKLSETVVEFKGTEKIEEVVTDKSTYKADIVVVAIGINPNTKFLENKNLNMDKGAIIVDQFGMTNIEDVYAAGDCATIFNLVKQENTYTPLATGANKLGRVVGENLCGKNTKYIGSLGSSCIQVIDMEAGRTGITEKEASDLNLDYKTIFIKDKNQTSYYSGQEDIFVKLIYDKNTKVILGGQIVGKKGAVLRVDVLASAIYNKMTTEELAMLDLCYAPPFARTWDVLNIAGNVAK